jgi:Predicted integral membrane protein (DUF2269)
MNWYTFSVFVHMLGLVAIFGGFVLLQNSGRRLRAATTWQEARPWLDLLRTFGGMVGGGGVMMLASGSYMTRVQWDFQAPWIVAGAVSALIFMVAGPLVAGRRLGALRRAAATSEGELGDRGRASITDPTLWSSIFAMNGLALAMVWLMVMKPGWTGAVLIPVVLAAIGWLAGARVTHGVRTPDHARPRERHAGPPLGRPHPG